jgi:hypothetical protein
MVSAPPVRHQSRADRVAVAVASTVGEYWSPCLGLLCSAAGMGAGVTQHAWRVRWIIVVIVSLVASSLIAWAHQRYRRLREAQAAQLQGDLNSLRQSIADEYQNDLAYLLDDRLKLLTYLVADAFCKTPKPTRVRAAGEARTAIMCMTSDVVGRSALQGTRANLFWLSTEGDERVMKLASGVSAAGRGDQSARVFRENSETMKATLKRQPRFEEQTNGVDEDGNPIRYATYATHPVAERTGKIWGVLTVDCLRTGDLQEKVDVPMMAILSTLIAMTYRCELI